MIPEALTALQASIEHWKRLAESVPNETAGETPCSDDCDLCRQFNEPEPEFWCERHNKCIGCPVSERTGSALCVDTPYVRAAIAWSDFTTEDATLSDWQAAARAELEFLQSLLPTEQGE